MVSYKSSKRFGQEIINYTDAKSTRGEVYMASDWIGSVGSGVVSTWLFSPPTATDEKECYVMFAVDCSVGCKLELYEGATATASGTSITAYNMDRTSAFTATSSMHRTPTLTASGTVIATRQVGAHRQSKVGGNVGTGLRILSPGSDYLIAITTQSAGASIAVTAQFYENDVS